MDLTAPLVSGLDWAFAHWLAIWIAAWAATVTVRAVNLVAWFIGLY